MNKERETRLIKHQGVFYRRVNLLEGTAIIVSGTVGAGILGIPYVVSKVGIFPGLALILILGILMMGLNLLVGELAARNRKPLQLVGFAKRYLGAWGGRVMSVLVYLMSFAVLTVYISGEAEIFSSLFDWPILFSGVFFWLIGFLLAFLGVRAIKTVEMFLVIGLVSVLVSIVMWSAPEVSFDNLKHLDLSDVLLPYGVILFAFTGAGAVPEAYQVLERKKNNFKKAIILAGVICILLYAMFTVVVVGVTGLNTTPIATIGLGAKVSGFIFLFGNIFAAISMGAGFLLASLSLRDSLNWDWKIPDKISFLISLVLPLCFFIFGLRDFIALITLAGGVFMSLKTLLIVLMYWRAKQTGDWEKGRYHLHHAAWIAIGLIAALTVGGFYSALKMF